MAKDTATEDPVTFLPDDSEWETVVEESGEKYVWENVGQQFIGTYREQRTISAEGYEPFDQQVFDVDGKVVTMNGGYKLREAFADIPKGSLVRITYVGDIDTGQPSPMKDFRVEVARRGA